MTAPDYRTVNASPSTPGTERDLERFESIVTRNRASLAFAARRRLCRTQAPKRAQLRARSASSAATLLARLKLGGDRQRSFDHLDRVADVNLSAVDHPRIQRHRSIETIDDGLQHLAVLVERIGIEGRHHTARPQIR